MSKSCYSLARSCLRAAICHEHMWKVICFCGLSAGTVLISGRFVQKSFQQADKCCYNLNDSQPLRKKPGKSLFISLLCNNSLIREQLIVHFLPLFLKFGFCTNFCCIMEVLLIDSWNEIKFNKQVTNLGQVVSSAAGFVQPEFLPWTTCIHTSGNCSTWLLFADKLTFPPTIAVPLVCFFGTIAITRD